MSARTVTVPTPAGPVEARLPRPIRVLPDGSVGYYQRRHDDCGRAALATVLQVPYGAVPPFEALFPLGSRAVELQRHLAVAEWARERGLRLVIADRPPEGIDTFIGVGPVGEDRYRHVVAVVKGKVFDPADGFVLPPGFQHEPFPGIEYVEFFEPIGERV